MLKRITGTALVTIAAGVCGAQSFERPVPRPIVRMVDALDSDDLATREEATAALVREALRPSQVDAQMIVRLITGPDLTPEQRARLLQVDRMLFANSPRPAMGISFGGERDAGVVIGSTIEHFDADEVLQGGDIVLEVEGEPMTSQESLRLAILSRDPGDRLGLKVKRGDEVIDCVVELGWFEKLNPNQARLTQSTLEAAWAERAHRLLKVQSESTPMIDARRKSTGDDELPSNMPGADATWDDEAGIDVAQGGASRLVPDPAARDTLVRQLDAQTLTQIRLDAMQRAQVRVGDDQEQALRRMTQLMLDRLGQPGITAAEKRAIENQIELLDLQIEAIERARAIQKRQP